MRLLVAFKIRECVLTQFAFGLKMLYLCNSRAGLSYEKARFLRVFLEWSYVFLTCFREKTPYRNLNSKYSC